MQSFLMKIWNVLKHTRSSMKQTHKKRAESEDSNSIFRNSPGSVKLYVREMKQSNLLIFFSWSIQSQSVVGLGVFDVYHRLFCFVFFVCVCVPFAIWCRPKNHKIQYICINLSEYVQVVQQCCIIHAWELRTSARILCPLPALSLPLLVLLRRCYCCWTSLSTTVIMILLKFSLLFGVYSTHIVSFDSNWCIWMSSALANTYVHYWDDLLDSFSYYSICFVLHESFPILF